MIISHNLRLAVPNFWKKPNHLPTQPDMVQGYKIRPVCLVIVDAMIFPMCLVWIAEEQIFTADDVTFKVTQIQAFCEIGDIPFARWIERSAA